MRRSLIMTAFGGTTLAASLLAASLLAAVPVVADPGGPAWHREASGKHRAGWGGPGMGHGMAGRLDRLCENRDARIAGLLAYTQTRLGITDAQQADWTRFADTVKQSGAAFDGVCAKAGTPPPATLPERLARMEEVAEAGAEALGKVRPAAEEMYAKLTPEQRKLADEMMRRGHHRR